MAEESVGDRIARLRRKQKINGKPMKQGQLAELVGLSTRAIGAYERGERTPRKDELARLARALGKPEAYIMFGDRSEGSASEKSGPEEHPRVAAIARNYKPGEAIRRFDLHTGLGSSISFAIDDARDQEFTREELFALLDTIQGWGMEAEHTINRLHQEVRRLSRNGNDKGDS